MSDFPNQPRERLPWDIASHTLHRCIGRGSYGDVWLASDVMGKWRAVKVILRRTDGRLDRAYEREFEAINRYEEICHSDGSFLTILSVGQDPAGRFFYYGMDLADDATSAEKLPPPIPMTEVVKKRIQRYQPRTLRAEIRQQGRLPAATCVEYGLALARALEKLHANGLIHRDIKPDNIIFVYGRPKLADVGLVKQVEATYSLAGTTAYLSPEGDRKEPADIFALGKVLYEMTTGRDADEFPLPPEDFGRFTEGERTAFNELNEVILRACQPEPKDRYASARHLRDDLELLQRKGSVIRSHRLEERHRRMVRRSLTAVAAAILMTAVALLGAYIWTTKERASEQSRRRELRELQISRLKPRTPGWFTRGWSQLQRLAAVRNDQETLEQAVALLPGLDAQLEKALKGASFGSVAFGADGIALVAGVGSNAQTLLINTNGGISVCPVRGVGPVGWTPQGIPLQLIGGTNRLILRDVGTGHTQVQMLFPECHESSSSQVSACAVASDAGHAAAVVGDRLFMWDAGTGALLGSIRDEATVIAFSPDGSLLAGGAADGTVHVYSIPNLTKMAVLPASSRGKAITCMAFGRDPVVRYREQRRTNAWLLATGDKGAGIVIWDLDRSVPRSFCRGSTWAVNALAFSPDGSILASAGRNQPRLWDVATGQSLLLLEDDAPDSSLSLAFDHTGQRVICAGEPISRSAGLAIWKLDGRRGIQALRGLAAPVRQLWFSPDSQRLAALSDDWQVAIWNIHSGHLMLLLETPTGIFADAAGGCFDATGRKFAFATGSEACLFDLTTGCLLRKWELERGLSDQLQFDAQGRLLLLRTESAPEMRGRVWRLYQLAEGDRPVLMYEASDVSAYDIQVALAAHGARFLVWDWEPAGVKRSIQGYEVQTGQQLWHTTTECTNYGLRVCLDPTGTWFCYLHAARGHDSLYRIMRFSDFREVRSTSIDCRAIGPTGLDLAGGATVHLSGMPADETFSLKTDGSPLGDGSSFSPDGKLLAWGTEEGVVLVADVEEVWRRLRTLR